MVLLFTASHEGGPTKLLRIGEALGNQPTVTAIDPDHGPTTGGTTVTLTGTNFVAGATLTIGGVMATGVNVTSATTITGVTGAYAGPVVPITVEAVVTNPDGQVGHGGAFTYNAPPPPPALLTLFVNGGTSADIAQDAPESGALTFTGTGYNRDGPVTRRIVDENGVVVEIPPDSDPANLFKANAEGEIAWRFRPTCTTPPGRYVVSARNTEEPSRWSNDVYEYVIGSTRCSEPRFVFPLGGVLPSKTSGNLSTSAYPVDSTDTHM